MNTEEIMNKGMTCLEQKPGILEAEQYKSTIIQEGFDYTEWQRALYDQFTPDELHDRVLAYAQAHPYNGKAKVLVE